MGKGDRRVRERVMYLEGSEDGKRGAERDRDRRKGLGVCMPERDSLNGCDRDLKLSTLPCTIIHAT